MSAGAFPALDAGRIRLAVSGGAARITLTRGEKHNALDPQMLQELLDALTLVERDGDVRVLVIDAEGPAFCAGVDLGTPFFMEHVDDPSVFAGMRLLDEQHRLISAVHRLPQLTIACLQGNAVGGAGLGLAMACDLRYARRGSRFWMIPGSVDVVQDFGLTWLMQRVIGPSRTMEMAFTGQRVDADTAERWGFVNQVFDSADDLRTHVDSLAAGIGVRGADASRLLKHVVRHGADSSLEDSLKLEAITNSLCFGSTEFQTAKARFLDALRTVRG
ncbi:2-(1,2-epoxy-1,2-dihydrophenyl)acetyl-CoA isomerase [Blastococcus colisei]|uniref:2-(1,2-epoxy-1,2-dihydrophenyl)acetyl-CoA isomerase n=1 Tax=Blastococcus colisei TaxID=1564162 RepID=A0A543PG53_9ACTN|nr:enoyl-CoA hydratase/isomerase family protein [Blastococcus colisei]TQN43059.1 2-(1,2-epoxy-1,2-dihydrophenyl)acetyl-CoA isomerase [Blastococcus colisei]